MKEPQSRAAQVFAKPALLTSAFSASAQTLTEAQARAVIAPWYSLFNQPVQGEMKTLQEQVRQISGGQRLSPPAMGSPERVTPGTERSALTV